VSHTPFQAFDSLATAYGQPIAEAQLKAQPQDFRVEEVLGFELEDEGEHLWLWLEKVGQNTDWLAKQLAKALNLPISAIGYAGKKDRQAITRQWFSIPLSPAREKHLWTKLKTLPGVHCLKSQRHVKKCRIGDHLANRFQLILRFDHELKTPIIEQLNQRLQQIETFGFPNYFGKQRFGHAMQNLQQGIQLLQNPRSKIPRHLKGLYLSAVRSALFNEVLSHRLKRGNWQPPLSGEVPHPPEKCSTNESMAFYLTGPLLGDGDLGTEQAALALELAALKPFEKVWQGLKQARLKPERRLLTCRPQSLSWQFSMDTTVLTKQTKVQQTLHLQFTLPKGSYATLLVRELLKEKECA